MAINNKDKGEQREQRLPLSFYFRHLAFAERRKSNYVIKLLFRGMIKRIAFVGVGKAHGLIVLGIGKQAGGEILKKSTNFWGVLRHPPGVHCALCQN